MGFKCETKLRKKCSGHETHGILPNKCVNLIGAVIDGLAYENIDAQILRLPVLGSLLLTHMQGQTPAKTFRKVVSQYEIGAGDDFLRRIEGGEPDIAACGVVRTSPTGGSADRVCLP